jgi:hypothetical protein
MSGKRSQAELRRLIGAAVDAVCRLPRSALWLCITRVEAAGKPPSILRVWATLHFLPTGSPFCCGEPGCHLGLSGERLAEVGDHIRRAMRLRQPVAVEFAGRIGVQYYPGVEFRELG